MIAVEEIIEYVGSWDRACISEVGESSTNKPQAGVERPATSTPLRRAREDASKNDLQRGGKMGRMQRKHVEAVFLLMV